MRENVERLTGVRDWAEAFFATALVFEPLVGELFRSGFVMQTAALQGDFVTPTLVGSGESDVAREQRGARGAVRRCSPTTTSTARRNKADDADWLATWTPVSVAAARKLQPIWSQPAEKSVRFEDSFERCDASASGDLLSEIGLETPKEAMSMSATDRFKVRPHVVQPGGRDADEQPGRPRRRRRHARARTT